MLLFIPPSRDEPREERGAGRMVLAPDGSSLRLDTFGNGQGPKIILTHGWGLNSSAWWYTKKALADRFHLITWDLPGRGRSKPARDGKIALDRFAEALGAVIEASGPGPVLLVGHSIGGMTTQTFWRACPQSLKGRVAGVVLMDTTYQDPIQTMWLSPLWRALR